MRAAVLGLLLAGPALAGGDNPFLPDYPFKSAVVTYRKVKLTGAELEMKAFVKGTAVALRSRQLQGGKVTMEILTICDGSTVFTVTRSDGKIVSASKYAHPGTHVAGDFAAMTDEQKAAFRKRVEGLWSLYSPVYFHNIARTSSEVRESAEERVADRPCVRIEWENSAGLKVWRWKGTDLILKRERAGKADLEAEKVETDVEVSDEIFQPPGEAQFKADSGDAVFDAKIARELFVRFGGVLQSK